MEFDMEMALQENFAPMPSQDAAAFAGEVAWDRVQSAVEKLKRRIIPRHEILQQNKNYKKMLEEYDSKMKIMAEERQSMLVERAKTLEKIIILEMMYEESDLKVKDLEVKLDEANSSMNALNANIQQLEKFVENKDDEILGLRTELKLQEPKRTPEVPTKTRSSRMLLKHLHMFAKAAEKKDGLDSTLKRLLMTHYKQGTKKLQVSDVEEDSMENNIHTRPPSVDTGQGSSLASSDDEKGEQFPNEPAETPQCISDIYSPICSPSSSTPGVCIMPEVLYRKRCRDAATSPITVQYKEVSTSPIRKVTMKSTESDSEDDILKLTRPMHTNIVPTSPMPIEPQDSECPCGKECRLTNNWEKPARKLTFESQTKLISRKSNNSSLKTVLKTHIDREIKYQLERKWKRKVDRRKSSNTSQETPKKKVWYTSEQVAHLLLAMGKQNIPTNTVRLTNETPLPHSCDGTDVHLVNDPDNNIVKLKNYTTQTALRQTPEFFQLASLHDSKSTSFEECYKSKNISEKSNDISVGKISSTVIDSGSVTPLTALIEEQDTDRPGEMTNGDHTAADNSSSREQQDIFNDSSGRPKQRISRKQPVTKLENLRNKLTRKSSSVNCSDLSPPMKKNKKSSLSAPQNTKCIPTLRKNLEAYQRAVQFMAELNNTKKKQKCEVELRKIGIVNKEGNKKPIENSTNEHCNQTKDNNIVRHEHKAQQNTTRLYNTRIDESEISNDQTNDLPSNVGSDGTRNANNVSSNLKRKTTATKQLRSKLCKTNSRELLDIGTPDVPTLAQSQIQANTQEKLSCNLPEQVVRRQSSRLSQMNRRPLVPPAMIQGQLSLGSNEKPSLDLTNSQHTSLAADMDVGGVPAESTANGICEAGRVISYQDLSLFDDSVCTEPAPVHRRTAPPSTTIPYFLQIIERYAPQKGRRRVVNDKAVNAKLVEQVTKHISSALQNSPDEALETLDKLMEQLQKENYKCALRAFIGFLCNQQKSELEQQGMCPPISGSERAALYCAQRMRQHWPQLPVWDSLLDAIQYKLFRLNASPPYQQVENLSRFYALICRITRNMTRLRIFVVDALYSLTVKSIYAVVSVLDVWYHVLPLEKNELANDPLVVSIVHLLHYTQGESDILNRMRERLSRKFGYRPGECDQRELLARLNASMRDPHIRTTEDSLYIAFLLVGKRYGTEWCHTNLLQGILLPLLGGGGPESQGARTPARALAAQLLGPLVRPFPAQMRMQSQLVRDRLMKIIQAGVEVEVEFGALQSALVACDSVARPALQHALLAWNPRAVPPLPLRRQLRRLAQRTDLRAWKQIYALCFQG